MTADFVAVLDANVLVQAPLRDTLLRLAEHPRNKRDFPPAATKPWEIEVQGPSTFLKFQYDLNPPVVIDKLQAQARNLGRTLPEQLAVLRAAAPSFVDTICQDLGTYIAP